MNRFITASSAWAIACLTWGRSERKGREGKGREEKTQAVGGTPLMTWSQRGLLRRTRYRRNLTLGQVEPDVGSYVGDVSR